MKTDRVMTTEQIVNHTRAWKAEQQADKPEAYRDLNRWVFLQWKPGAYPKSVIRMKQKAIHSYYCWESIPKPGFLGLSPLTVYLHGIQEVDSKSRSVMRPGKKLEYERKKAAPAEGRESWTRAAAEVAVTEPVAVEALEKMLASNVEHKTAAASFLSAPASHLTMNPKRKAKLKGDTCNGKQPVKIQVAALKKASQEALITECKSHCLPYGGQKKDMAKRLKLHYEKVGFVFCFLFFVWSMRILSPLL